mmetsp:Transcript_103522/g.299525  ORF Transcript_103522/g.299525 Transcript_103522/m.299525 type:complete len:291 (+) Transcript_103522:159-1031(+)
MHRRDGEVALLQLVGKEVDLAASVAIDDRLRDGQCLVQVAEGVEFPLLLLDRHVELANTLERQLVLLYQDPHRIPHELRGQVQNLRGHRGGEEADLDVRRQGLEDVVDLVLEAAGQHLIGLVQHESDEVVHDQAPLADHVVNAAGCADDDVLAVAEAIDVVADGGPSDASVAADVHVVAQRQRHLLDLVREFARGCENQGLARGDLHVDALEHADHECGRLSGSGLGLADCVAPIKDGLDPALLDRARLLEAVGVDPSEQVLFKVIVIEGLEDRVLFGAGHGHTLTGHGS